MSKYKPTDFIGYETSYLGEESMRNNVRLIVPFFRNEGWTDNAIAGMLGNMQTESSINPNLWQGREIPADPTTTDKGYGLTQWTPARKLITWAEVEGLNYTSGFAQMFRIKYERENNVQWSTNNILNYTWDDYVVSTESPEILARVFVWAYERPEDPNIEKRQQDARKWFNFMHSWQFNKPPWLLFKFNERRGFLK